MSIVITWSDSNGGTPISEPLVHGAGSVSNGDTTSPNAIYLSHNAVNPITLCSLYLSTFSDTYTGDFTAASDSAELISWGDAGGATTFGGIQLNQNATGSFPNSSWPTLANKTTADGYGFTIRTGVGDSSSNGIQILAVAGAASDGTLQAGSSPDVKFKIRVVIPTDLDTAGLRLFETVLKFTFTS